MDSGTLLTQLQDYDSQRKNSVDVLNEAMSKYGVPEIRSRVSGLRTTLSNTENALNNVDPSVTGRTSGSLVTEAQRQRQVANERAPIAEQYGQQSRALGDESANLSDQEKAAQILAEGSVNDYNAGRTALSSRYETTLARELEQRRREEADRAYQLSADEAKRQAAASVSGGYSLGGGVALPSAKAAPAASGVDQQGAYNAIKSLLGTNNKDTINKTVQAIQKSAGNGNAYDKYKLELISSIPDFQKYLVGNYSQLKF